MSARASSRRGSEGDAPARAQGGGDARPRSAREPCVYFLKGSCARGTKCRFRHIQTPNRNGDRRIFTFEGSQNRQQGQRPANKRRGLHQPNRQQRNAQARHRRQPLTCFNCGQPGHLKKDCNRNKGDFANVVVDFALPAVEIDHAERKSRSQPIMQPKCRDDVNMADNQQSDLSSCWLIDGGASCHVVGFDPGSALQNRRSVTIDIIVGGGQRIKCEHVGDLVIVVRTSNPITLSRITLHDVRVVPSFGSNLLSAPRMEKAGWYLTQGGGQFKAKDGKGHVVFTVAADFKGLYYLENVTILKATSSPTYLHRNFPSGVKTSKNSSASQFFAMGVNDKNCQVSLLPSEPVCRLGVSQAKRYVTSSHLHVSSIKRNVQPLCGFPKNPLLILFVHWIYIIVNGTHFQRFLIILKID